MEPDTSEDHLLIDLGPEDQWVNPEITNAVNALQEALYSAGCNVNNMKITIGGVPGEDATINGDYGIVKVGGSIEDVYRTLGLLRLRK